MMKDYLPFAGLTGLALVLGGLILWSINSLITTLAAVLMIVGGALIIGFLVLNFKQIKEGLSSRSTKFGTNAALMIVFVFGILIVVNILLSKFNARIDTTAAKQFSLAEQTKKVLKNLDQPVQVTAFLKSGEDFQARSLFVEYSSRSPHFKWEIVDPDRKPSVAKSMNVTSYGTIVLQRGTAEERLTKSSEEDLTNALIKVSRESVKKICFTIGHGERPLENTEADGLSALQQGLKDEKYEVESINLAMQDPVEVPDECTVLVIAGPRTDLLPNEKQALEAFLKKGGKVLMMLDPESPDSYVDFCLNHGIRVGHDVVVDASGIGQLFGAGPIMPLVSDYADHAIVQDFNVMTFYNQARSVSRAEAVPSGLTVTEVAKTNPRSWGETTPLSQSQRLEPNPEQDLLGPVSLLAVAEKRADDQSQTREDQFGLGAVSLETRLAVFGDSDFATNGMIRMQGNRDLVLNTVSWLAEEEDLISVRAKAPEDRRLSLTQKQSRLILYFGVILLPFFIFVTGILVYIRRK
ncbi:GldG family protein [candidate division KSB1 bacterium]|nr:GldG family protein [candidate division KSB1 bacterium]